jgi:hypothetical protein
MGQPDSYMNWGAGLAVKGMRTLVPFTGILVNSIFNFAFDYILYPFMIWKLGLIKGGAMMMVLSASFCYMTVLFYDWLKRDWLGIETIKSLREYSGNSRTGRVTSWILTRGDIAALIFLSIKFDSFVTTIYMRRGAHKFEGLDTKSKVVFLVSTMISDGYWAITMYMAVNAIEMSYIYFLD